MRRLLPLLLLVFALPRCSCDEDPAANGNDAGMGGDGSTPETGPGSMCIAEGQACSATGTICCSGVCNADGVCAAATLCSAPGVGCVDDLECCTFSCVDSVCSTTLCSGIGQSCQDSGDCCSNICGGDGTCQPVPPGPGGETCGTLGEACTSSVGSNLSGDCCSTNCQGGVCVRAAPCQANGDICLSDMDCCGNLCSSNDGVTPGRCVFETGGGGGGCIQGGNPCGTSGGSNCCSRICVDIGSGVPVCQLAGGCRLTGEWCLNDDHCCGGGMNPNGTVECRDAPGRCDNGQACNPVGNICGAPVLANGGSINASQNCCDGRKEVCKLDSSGIPRCFGGCPNDMCPMECPTGYDPLDPNCCIPTGDECQFRDQCCNYAPCVADMNGILRCGATPDCVQLGDVCMPGAPPGANGCCGGLNCVESSVAGVFVCNRDLDPGTGGDGGVPDGQVVPDGGVLDGQVPEGGVIDTGPVDMGTPCAPNGTNCTAASQCCSQICNNGVCADPQQCQPQDAVCSADSDCCAGLSCSIPVGQTNGTCQPGATCGNTGQACSANAPCCQPLRCVNLGTLVDCNGTTACSCIIDL